MIPLKVPITILSDIRRLRLAPLTRIRVASGLQGRRTGVDARPYRVSLYPFCSISDRPAGVSV
jgi:hypothetical protein